MLPGKRLIAHDAEALALWTEATRREPVVDPDTGRFTALDNVQNGPPAPTGNSRERALRQLNKAEAAGDERAADASA